MRIINLEQLNDMGYLLNLESEEKIWESVQRCKDLEYIEEFVTEKDYNLFSTFKEDYESVYNKYIEELFTKYQEELEANFDTLTPIQIMEKIYYEPELPTIDESLLADVEGWAYQEYVYEQLDKGLA